MNWFSSLFKRKDSAVPDDRYVMRLTIGHETYAVEEFDLKFKRDTDRDGLPEGEAYGGFVTCTLTGMPGDGLLRWAAYSRMYEDGDLRIYRKRTRPAGRIRPALYGGQLHPFPAKNRP